MKHLVVFLLIAGVGLAQEGSDRVVVPFSDPAKPRALRVKLMNGGVTIHGYEGKDAIIEAKMDPGKGKAPRQRPDGLRRLDIVTSGLFVEEQDSVVTVGAKPN